MASFNISQNSEYNPEDPKVEISAEFYLSEAESLAEQIIKVAGCSFAYYLIAQKNQEKLPEEWHNEMIALSLKDDYFAKEYFKLLKNT